MSDGKEPGHWYWVAGQGPHWYRGPDLPLLTPRRYHYHAGPEQIMHRLDQAALDDYRENCRVRNIRIPMMREGAAPMSKYKCTRWSDGWSQEEIQIVEAETSEAALEEVLQQECQARQLRTVRLGFARDWEIVPIGDEWVEYRALGYHSTAASRGAMVAAEAVLECVEESADFDTLVEKLAALCGWRRRGERPD